MMTHPTRTELKQIESLIPRLRRFAICMCGSRHIADECVERALKSCLEDVRGLTAKDLETWAFFRTRREARDQVSDTTDIQAGNEADVPSLQDDVAFRSLEADQKEVLLLVVTEGLSITQTAYILELPPELVKECAVTAKRAYQSYRDENISMANHEWSSGSLTVQPLYRAST